MSENNDAAPPVERPRLNLKPRDPQAVARLEAERSQQASKSPFGAAKPRERIIAEREGKSEEDILKEEVSKEKLHLRLNPTQVEEKRSHEAAVKEIEDQITAEEDEGKKDVLRVELTARQTKLEQLMDRFAKITLETALSGEAPRVSQIRRQQEAAIPVSPVPPVPGQYNQRYNPTQHYAGPPRGGYNNMGPRGGPGSYDHYHAGGRGSYGGHRGGHRGGYHDSGHSHHYGGGGLPEWARDETDPSLLSQFDGKKQMRAAPGGRGNYYYTPASHGNTGGGVNGDSDNGFYDQPGGGRGYNRGRGRSRGRSGGRHHMHDAGAPGTVGAGSNINYFDTLSTAGYASGPGRGVGGEIEFDTFAGQDRY